MIRGCRQREKSCKAFYALTVTPPCGSQRSPFRQPRLDPIEKARPQVPDIGFGQMMPAGRELIDRSAGEVGRLDCPESIWRRDSLTLAAFTRTGLDGYDSAILQRFV